MKGEDKNNVKTKENSKNTYYCAIREELGKQNSKTPHFSLDNGAPQVK